MAERAWKQKDEKGITHSVAHHLVAIAELREERGYARVTDVAKHLGITRGSASLTLTALKQRGLVTEDDNRFLLLSVDGAAVARAVRAKNALIEKFLREVLCVSPDSAKADACQFEHLVSDETAKQLVRFVRFIESNGPAAFRFLEAWTEYRESCNNDPETCPACEDECLHSMFDD